MPSANGARCCVTYLHRIMIFISRRRTELDKERTQNERKQIDRRKTQQREDREEDDRRNTDSLGFNSQFKS